MDGKEACKKKDWGYQDMVTGPRPPSPRCQAMPLRCLSLWQLAVRSLGYNVLLSHYSHWVVIDLQDIIEDVDHQTVECSRTVILYIQKKVFMAFVYGLVVVCIELGLPETAIRPVVQSSLDLCHQSVHFGPFEGLRVNALTAVAAAQTMAIGTSNSIACWPCWTLDVKRWLCFSANDIPQVEVKTNSFRTEMMQGCRNGFVHHNRPDYMADKV